jgi:hypothetical protein
MKLAFQKIDTLPRLAWCARIEKLNPTVHVMHGRDVETSDWFFCEGAWAGEYQAGGFHRTFFLGSGGEITGNQLLVSSPSQTMERLYVLRRGDTLLVSNSCAFVFAQSNDRPDPTYLLYASDIASIIHGLRRYIRSIPTKNGHRIQMFSYCNLAVGPDLELAEIPKNSVREFVDFADYRAFLKEQIGAITVNANAPHRRVHYRPIATISSGYDSPASAVFAKGVGCTEAVTFRRARGDIDDSGANIAELLGMTVQVFDRFDYLRQPGFPEAEAGISEFPALAAALERRMLFTGFNGSVWDLVRETVGPFIERRDTSGNSLSEFRLRVGFVHVPVPYLGCTSHPSIHQISTSSAMRPWSVGTKYDKPIARRLVEEAGVARGMFGVQKKAVAIVPEEGFERVMTPESFADLSRFLQEHETVAIAAKLRWYRVRRYLDRVQGAVTRRVLGRNPLHSHQTGIDRVVRWGRYSLMFHWSMDKLIPRYTVDSGATNGVGLNPASRTD